MERGIILTALLLIGTVLPAQAATPKPAELSPAEKLYRQAYAELSAGDPKKAIQTAAQTVADYPHDEVWMPKTELLCVVLYMKLGMLDSAAVTARQMQKLYKDTEFAANAALLQKEIEQLNRAAGKPGTADAE